MPVKIDNNYLNSKTGNGPMIHSGENDNWSISRWARNLGNLTVQH